MNSNFSEREVGHFDRLASRWWDPDGEFATLHQLNPVRLAYIEQSAGLAGRRCLDVGCGGGLLTEAMARAGAIVTGIDLAAGSLEVARLHLLESPELQIDYQHIAAADLAAREPQSFDVVTCMEVLEHVPDPAALLRSLGTLVRPGGDVLLATINRTPRAFFSAIVGAEYLLRLLPRGTHRYEQLIRPAELERWARQAGLQLRSMTGVQYKPLSRSFRLVRDPGINYMMHFRAMAAGT